jgi:lipoprotein-releasing system ATP-binding protein
MDLVCELNDTLEQTFLMVTHDPELTGRADRILHMRDGRLTKG